MESLEYIVNHVILPPKLPHEAENPQASRAAEQHLLRLLSSKIESYCRQCQRGTHGTTSASSKAWGVLKTTLLRCATVTSAPNLSAELITSLFAKLVPEDVLLVPIKAQNAMLILRRTKELVIFECFEASPSAGAVIGCKGSLLCRFPAQARAVRVSTFDDPRFRSELAAALTKLDIEVINEMMPQSQKAGSKMAEIRDTAHPGLVSDMLMAILASLGEPVQAQQISKRIRDDVLWSKALLPWRRSPLWLAIRVTIQTTLCRELQAEEGNIQYKNFMIYLISEIASMALRADEPVDKCHAILAKIAHRVHKLGVSTLDLVQKEALDTCQRVRAGQSGKWDEVRRLDADRPTTIQISPFARDTALTLRMSRPYLDVALAYRENSAPSATSFVPNCRPGMGWHRGLPKLDTSNTTKEDLVFVLAEFERWVEVSLPPWVAKFDSCSPAPEDCMALANLGESYWRTAETAYADAPEQLSMMLLIIAEFWYAVDRLAITLFPLLKQYSPVVSTDLFYPLLLRKKSYMQRLHQVERHIEFRYAHATPQNPSIFSDPRSRSFAVAYYATSASHKSLRAQIESEASMKKAAKTSEWEKTSEKHRRLCSEAKELECQNTTDIDGWTVHSACCKKCHLQSQANDMRISKYEWPLPMDEHACISAVFELDCPAGFVAWRNLTWMLTHDIGRPNRTPGDPYADTLQDYSGLRMYSQEKSSRMVLASKVKSFEKTHYTQKFPVRYAEVYSNNALHYEMLDLTEMWCWVQEQTNKPSLQHKCIQPLPNGPYSNLQFAVDSTDHTQNRVLAEQDICSDKLSIHEFISFGSLRADGERTQWLNIQRELTASNFTFNTEAVSTLFLQAAFQAGSSGDNTHRISHSILDHPAFCEELLAKIQENLKAVEANWKSDYAMILLVNLTLRTLSLAPDDTVVSLALDTLRRIRTIAQKWIGALRETLHMATEGIQVQNLQHRLLKAAMLCKLTYDVDTGHIPQVLDSDSDLSTWVISCVMVRENVPGDPTLLPPYTRRMCLHDTKLTHALHKVALRLVLTNTNLGLDQGILKVWPGFQSASQSWEALSGPNQRWVTAQTKASSGYASQTVLYNVLDGELLVDGRPLGRLPREYLNSDVYRRVFGSQLLDVFAADMPGMLYMTAREIHGYLAYFTIREGRVVIKLRQGSQVLEYVPHNVFVGDMPSKFVNDYAHWLDLSSYEIEFRPIEQRWTSDIQHWRLRYQPKTVSRLSQGNILLIDIRSATFAKTMDVFSVLETPENIHVSLASDGRLRVHFPRFDLHFFLNVQGHFQCHELCRIVDPDQSLETMIGLKNRLILCGIGQLARKHERLLLIPQGRVSISKTGTHVSVTMSTSGKKIRLFRYQIDGILRRLQGPGDITSTLYKAYLHAVTSYVLPDPFTGNTGTEEALACLRSQSMSLIKPADENILRLLTWIADLTPVRKLYPKHLRVMQQVDWSPQLSMMAQHDDFIMLAQQILSSGDRFLIFYPDSEGASDLYAGRDKDLWARAKLRNSGYLSSTIGMNVANDQWDVSYQARDRTSLGKRAARTFGIASLVRDWPQACKVSRRLLQELQGMGKISGFGVRFDSSEPLSELLDVSYAASWGSLLELCLSSSQQKDIYRLLFLFSTIAYSSKFTDPTWLTTLLAFAFSHELRAIGNPPPHASFSLNHGITFLHSSVRPTIQRHMEVFSPSRNRMSALERQTEKKTYCDNKEKQTNSVLEYYSGHWPCSVPPAPRATSSSMLKVQAANQEISLLFAHWTRNGELENYINRAQLVLDRVYEDRPTRNYEIDNWQAWQIHPRLDAAPLLPTVPMLMSAAPPKLPRKREVKSFETTSQTSDPNPKLQSLVEALGLEQGNSSIRKQYSDELLASLDAFCNHDERLVPRKSPYSLEDLLLDRIGCEHHVAEMLEGICDSLRPKTRVSWILEAGGIWPRLTIYSIIALLANLVAFKISLRWKSRLLALGEAITILQRARRLVLAGERNDVPNLSAELENVGRVGWEATLWPEWLLIEIENDLLIRPNQAQVALEMLSPSSSSNSLTQLNMGEGKSSVIVPLVAVAIANGSRLSRVIVLKSLAKQMSDTLAVRLGGLLDRPIYYMPFTRKIEITTAVVRQIQVLLEACKSAKGILLAQPEHLLSFKLMGIERLTAGDFQIASLCLKAQEWLEINARDLLDESDEILDVKFQLIYTLGTQRLMDGHPDRWLLTQTMLDLVEKHTTILQRTHPRQIEMNRRTSSSFPTIRLLSGSIGQLLMSKVADDVLDSHLPALSFEQCPTLLKKAVLRFIQNVDISEEDSDVIKRFYGHGASCLQNIFLIRGLIAYKILLFVLRGKRWSVNYGLHPTRCLSAVPYRAKDVPAPSAEFGHPDVAIALTCLSYYYSGLSKAQIRQCFELLSKADDPSLEYGAWISRCNDLPIHLRDWNAVNLEDEQQCSNELFPALRYCKKIADYFLANVVFPKEGKEFDERLSTSGWDVPAKIGGPHLTTGFSGTNDNRFLLPLSITQQDLPNLLHTSGKVLDFVVREENLRYFCARDPAGRQVSTKALLQGIAKDEPHVQVLIDVGAQVLDVSNMELVRTWMNIISDADAGIFFDKDDNVMVLTRDNKLETLTASSFQARMDRCLVYLDEVHTRGTDLKLPTNARAAVTLGPRLVKDKLVQACMRLRKLGQGQSLVFVAPPEVHQSIKDVTGKNDSDINGYDVVTWSLEQSCLSIERSQPLRVLQGLNHHQRQMTMASFAKGYPELEDVAYETDATKVVISAFREKEEQRLTDLYAPVSFKTSDVPSIIDSSQEDPDPTVQQLLAMWRIVDFSISEGASMHEEHEREVAHEVEQETQVQRPPRVKALEAVVDTLLRDFVRTGSNVTFQGFLRAHYIINHTTAKNPATAELFGRLRATTGFERTVHRPQSGYHDSYLRPVNWILTSKQYGEPADLLLVSQYEVNQLFEHIYTNTAKVELHTYEPRVTKAMRAVDLQPAGQTYPSVIGWQNLTRRLRRELHLFAGQLYFNSFAEYHEVLADITTAKTKFQTEQALRFLKAWIAIRRKGQNFLPTHIGQIVNNRTIKEGAFA